MASPIGLAIAMLVEAFNVKNLTPVRIKIYEKALSKLPPVILEPMVMRAIETRTSKCADWLPSIEELREDAEAVRLEMLAQLVFQPCAECSEQGWREREVGGAKRAVRCSCWHRHQKRVEALEVGARPLALPAPETME